MSHTVPAGKRRFAAYFFAFSQDERASWRSVDPMLLTHINFAFGHLKPDGTVFLPRGEEDEEILRALTAMRAKNPDLKIIISVGGWTDSGEFSSVAASEKYRARFVESTLALFDRLDLDGIDIDWEFPVVGGDDIEHREDDSDNFIALLRDLRTAFDSRSGKRFELSVAGGAHEEYAETVDLSGMMEYLDYINIMTYDYHTSLTPYTGHNAPLYPHAQGDLCVTASVEKYIEHGVKPEDINLGVPFYGRAWSLDADGGDGEIIGHKATAYTQSYHHFVDIREKLVNKNGFVRTVDDAAHAPYLFDGSVFISYDDEQSISEKINYAIERGLGGMMFWEFAGDSDCTLQRLIARDFLER